MLPEIAITLNLTRPRRLKAGTMPYEVHFSLKRHRESSVWAEYVALEESEDEWMEEEAEAQREHEDMVGLEELFGSEITERLEKERRTSLRCAHASDRRSVRRMGRMRRRPRYL